MNHSSVDVFSELDILKIHSMLVTPGFHELFISDMLACRTVFTHFTSVCYSLLRLASVSFCRGRFLIRDLYSDLNVYSYNLESCFLNCFYYDCFIIELSSELTNFICFRDLKLFLEAYGFRKNSAFLFVSYN
jgi:hypothetical protein